MRLAGTTIQRLRGRVAAEVDGGWSGRHPTQFGCSVNPLADNTNRLYERKQYGAFDLHSFCHCILQYALWRLCLIRPIAERLANQ